MRKIISSFALAATLLSATSAFAAAVVEDAWARATAPGQENGALQFSITADKAAKITAVSSPVAGAVEIHLMRHEAGRMEMRAIDAIDLQPGQKFNLAKNGNHIMLLKLKQPLKAGEAVPFALTLQYGDGGRETIEAKAEVRAPNAGHDMNDMHGMKGM